MKKLLTLIFLIAICGFSACEQVNPLAETATTGTNVQVTQGDPAAGDEDEDNDDDDDDN